MEDIQEKKHYLTPKNIVLTLIAVVFLLIAVRQYPPLMILGLDLLVIAGIILIPVIASKAWRYEIDRIGKIMRDLEHHMDAFHRLDTQQQEEYEQYHILKSTEQSIQTLTDQQQALTKEQRHQLRYLRYQNIINKLRLIKRAAVWTVRGMHPKRLPNHPSLGQNIRTIFVDGQFQSLRHLIIVWLLISFLIAYWAVR